MKTQFDPLFIVRTQYESLRAINKELNFLQELLGRYPAEEIEATLPSALKTYIESVQISEDSRQQAVLFLEKMKKNFLKKLPKKISQSQALENKIEEEYKTRQEIYEISPTQRCKCSCGQSYHNSNGLFKHQTKSKDPECKDPECKEESACQSSEQQQVINAKKGKKTAKRKASKREPKYSQSE